MSEHWNDKLFMTRQDEDAARSHFPMIRPLALRLALAPGDHANHEGMKYWEIIADRLSKLGWTWGCVAIVDDAGREIFVIDAHRDDGKHYVVRSPEKLTAFLELQKQTCRAELRFIRDWRWPRVA